MSRVLRRPMFRRGGDAGITTGLERQKYDNGDLVEKFQRRKKLYDQFAPQRSGALNDFLINFGVNLAGNAPTGNIFQTAAKQAQQPFQTFQAQKFQEQEGERALAGQIISDITDKDMIMLEQQAELLVDEGLYQSKEEALKALVFKKRQSPEDIQRERIDTLTEDFGKDVRSDEGAIINRKKAEWLEDYNYGKFKTDHPNLDVDEYDPFVREKRKKYVEGKVYWHPGTGKYYRADKQNEAGVLVEIDIES